MVFVLVGLPGCGKTTWAKKKQKETGIAIISRDDIRRCVYGQEFDIDNEGAVNLMFWSLYRAALQTETDLIVDCTNLVSHVRKRLINLATHYDYENEITAVVFNITLNESWKRKKAAGSKMSYADFDKLVNSYEEIGKDEEFSEIVIINSGGG